MNSENKKKAYKTMYIQMSKSLLKGLGMIIVVVLLFLLLNSYFKLDSRFTALITGISGVILAFIGNGMVMDAASRYDAPGLPQWHWGNRLQAFGFGLTVFALILSSS